MNDILWNTIPYAVVGSFILLIIGMLTGHVTVEVIQK